MKYLLLVVLIVVSVLLTACSSTPKRSQGSIESSSDAYAKLGIGYFRQNNRVLAIENLQKALEINPDSAAAHNYLAVVYQNYGRPKLADDHFQRALSLDDSKGEYHNNYGVFLYSSKQYKKAEVQFLKAVDDVKYETPAVAIEHAALSALGQSDKIKAEKYFRQALGINPKIPGVLLGMARLSFDKKKYLSVRAYIQRFAQAAKHTPQSLWLAIKAEKELKDQKEVVRLGIYLQNNFPESNEAILLLKGSASGS